MGGTEIFTAVLGSLVLVGWSWCISFCYFWIVAAGWLAEALIATVASVCEGVMVSQSCDIYCSVGGVVVG